MEEENNNSPKEAFEQLKKGKLKKSTIVGLVFLGIFAVVTILGFVFYRELRSKTGWFATHDTGIAFFNGVLRVVRLAARGADLLTDLLGPRGGPMVIDDDPRALPGQAAGDGPPDAAGRAGHDGSLAL